MNNAKTRLIIGDNNTEEDINLNLTPDSAQKI